MIYVIQIMILFKKQDAFGLKRGYILHPAIGVSVEVVVVGTANPTATAKSFGMKESDNER
ncbi:hypothetical protein C7B82_08060 [Stenomitos frigidus ULC18]|uniref:Uncharacterized protein n=2 Tax=Stenomitos TaxID=1844270 RepID=A0A2T1EDE9_9CYAN|nr:hypothetical protein C7B82_08060 [Stenomitos frigidus ULC18]